MHVTFVHDDAPVPLEIQIRTMRMHEVAETGPRINARKTDRAVLMDFRYGMAAHWIYKDEQRGKPYKSWSPAVGNQRKIFQSSIL